MTTTHIDLPAHFTSIAAIARANRATGEAFFDDLTDDGPGGPLAFLAGRLDGSTCFITRSRPFTGASAYATWAAYPDGRIVPLSKGFEFSDVIKAREAVNISNLGSQHWGNQTLPVVASGWIGG